MSLFLANRILNSVAKDAFVKPTTTGEMVIASAGKFAWDYFFIKIDATIAVGTTTVLGFPAAMFVSEIKGDSVGSYALWGTVGSMVLAYPFIAPVWSTVRLVRSLQSKKLVMLKLDKKF
jgi:hypothetical protein